MGTIKNKSRIERNSQLIENYVKSSILDADCVLTVDLFHAAPISLANSKKKIRKFFDRIRSKVGNSEYILLTNMDNQIPTHKMLVQLKESTSKFEVLLRDCWTNSVVEVAKAEDADKLASRFTDYYSDAVENLYFSRENSKLVKSKIFQKSRIGN